MGDVSPKRRLIFNGLHGAISQKPRQLKLHCGRRFVQPFGYGLGRLRRFKVFCWRGLSQCSIVPRTGGRWVFWSFGAEVNSSRCYLRVFPVQQDSYFYCDYLVLQVEDKVRLQILSSFWLHNFVSQPIYKRQDKHREKLIVV
jgi:hypothetical protein